jgi:hypothetical protein
LRNYRNKRETMLETICTHVLLCILSTAHLIVGAACSRELTVFELRDLPRTLKCENLTIEI